MEKISKALQGIFVGDDPHLRWRRWGVVTWLVY